MGRSVKLKMEDLVERVYDWVMLKIGDISEEFIDLSEGVKISGCWVRVELMLVFRSWERFWLDFGYLDEWKWIGEK